MSDHETHLAEAVRLAFANVAEGGSAYGAVLVRDGAVIARAANGVHRSHDPTDHAEIAALRIAAQAQGSPDLAGAVMYASGQPCPMCHAAMRMSGIREGWFAYTAEEAERHGAGSAAIYAELCRPLDQQPMRLSQMRPAGEAPYAAWAARRGGT